MTVNILFLKISTFSLLEKKLAGPLADTNILTKTYSNFLVKKIIFKISNIKVHL